MKLEKIGNIAQFINGYPFKPTEWEDSGKKIIRIQNLTDPTKPYNKTNLKVPEKYLVKKGDILVSWSATIDVFEWNDEESLLNQHIFKVVFDDKKIIKEYFKQAIKKTVAELAKCAHGATMKHVVKGDFDNHKIPLPSLEEQIQIATVLSKAENLIAKRKQSIELLDEFVKSTFLEMFGDPVRNEKGFKIDKLKNYFIVEPQNGLYKHSSEYGEGTFILRIDSFYNGKVTGIDSLKRVKLNPDEIEKYSLSKNDIVINRVNSKEYLGKVGLIPTLKEATVFESNMMRFSVDSTVVNSQFLVMLLSSSFVKSQILRAAKDAVNQSSINQQDVKNFDIIVPPISLQNQFAEIVNKVEVLKEKYQKSLEELENLYGSLSQKFLNHDSEPGFTGLED